MGLFNRGQEPSSESAPADVTPRFPDSCSGDILDAAGYPKIPGNIDMVLRTACQTAATSISPDDVAGQPPARHDLSSAAPLGRTVIGCALCD